MEDNSKRGFISVGIPSPTPLNLSLAHGIEYFILDWHRFIALVVSLVEHVKSKGSYNGPNYRLNGGDGVLERHHLSQRRATGLLARRRQRWGEEAEEIETPFRTVDGVSRRLM